LHLNVDIKPFMYINDDILLVPLCPVTQVDNGLSDTSNCLTPDRCLVNTTIHYMCDAGYVVSSPTTTCMANHTWSPLLTCAKGTLNNVYLVRFVLK